MNFAFIAIGIVALGYGIYTYFARKSKPEQFKKLEPMKKVWGEKLGYTIHVIGYTIIPIIVGIILIIAGILGL